MRRFVETPTARMIFAEVESAVLNGNHCLITGRAGVGKTAALVELARRDRRAAYMEMRPAQASPRGTLRLFGHALGIDCHRQHLYQIDEVLLDRLPEAIEHERYVIIDEAQMVQLQVVQQLQLYSDYWQRHGVGSLPIIFAGNDYTLKRTRASADGLDQVITRIGNGHRPLTIKGISAVDVDAFAVEYDVERDAYDMLRRFARGGNCRTLIAVLEEAKRRAGRGPVRSAELREALLTLHGPEAVKVVPLAKPNKQQERKIA